MCVTKTPSMQDLPPGAPDTFVTLNPPRQPAREKLIRRLALAHPALSSAAAEAQRALPSIQVGVAPHLKL